MSTLLQDQRGGIYGCLGILLDITDRKLAEQALARTSNELRLKNETMEADLHMARELQMALLSHNYPKDFPLNVSPKNSLLRFSHRYIPAYTLGGDFFEIIPVSDHEVGLLIYDVMGHGVKAALITAYMHGLTEELTSVAHDPVAFIKRLNKGLNAVITQFYSGMFVTAFYLVTDTKSGTMRFINAGHPEPYIIKRSIRAVDKMKSSSNLSEPALGLFIDHDYTASECPMNEDDIILLFTDGIYDVVDKNQNLFGEKRLFKTVTGQMHEPPEKMLDGILTEIKEHAGTNEFDDDVCMVAMHVRKT